MNRPQRAGDSARRHGSARARPRASRAQTTLDFAVGASVFLLTVAFAFGFVPTIFQPYTTGASSDTVFADRTVRHVSEDALTASPAEPYALDPACTAAFFVDNDDKRDDYTTDRTCEFDVAAADDWDALLGADGRSVNVTVHELNETSSAPVTFTYDGDDVPLGRGPANIPSDVVVAQRVVSLDDQQYRLTVRVW